MYFLIFDCPVTRVAELGPECLLSGQAVAGLHCTALHRTALNCTALHWTAQPCIPMIILQAKRRVHAKKLWKVLSTYRYRMFFLLDPPTFSMYKIQCLAGALLQTESSLSPPPTLPPDPFTPKRLEFGYWNFYRMWLVWRVWAGLKRSTSEVFHWSRLIEGGRVKNFFV